MSIVCRLCGTSGDFRTLVARCRFDKSEIIRYICPECDVVFGPISMIEKPLAELADEYARLYASYSENDATAHELALFEQLNPFRRGCYLNFGQGKNRTVGELRGRGYEVYSFDLAVEGDYALTGDQVAAMRFDGIFSHNVIEHLQDPVRDFRFLASVLKADGRMAHATSEYIYATPDTRFHLFFFLGRSVWKLAEIAGLSVAGLSVLSGAANCAIFTRAT